MAWGCSSLLRFFSCLVFLFSVFNFPTFADDKSPPLPNVVAVVGDSISEALLTDFSFEHPPTDLQLIDIVLTARDSVTNRDAFRAKYARPQHSWATGWDESDIVFSHLERIATAKAVRGYNYAISGSASKDLDSQFDRLLSDEQSRGDRVDYLMMLIGANDIDSLQIEKMTSPMVYSQNIERNLRRVLDVEPRREILILGLPDIFRVFEQTKDSTSFTFFGHDFKCDDVRKMVYGDLILFHPEWTEQYAQVKTLFTMYQDAVEKLVVRLQKDYPMAYVKTIQDYPLEGNLHKALSIDCFHPSQWGQAALAEIAWENGFWPDLDLGE